MDGGEAEAGRGAALVIGHPGHELFVHHWMARARPRVCVLTDGSGLAGVSRLDHTSAVLEERGARPGSVYGRLTDRDVYDALLDGDRALFVGIARELAKELAALDGDIVVGDSAEGFSPTHDLCRLLINAAVARVQRETGRAPASYDFAQQDPPFARGSQPPGCVWLDLDADAFRAKRRAAEGYTPIAAEVVDSLARLGEESFRHECLRPVHDPPGRYLPPDLRYERGAEELRRRGVIRRVIRHREHLLPVAEALARDVAGA